MDFAKKMTDEHILLDWEITREFTAMSGRAFLTLTGTDSKNNVVAKWTGHPVQIRKDPKGTQPFRRRINWNSLKVRLTRQSKKSPVLWKKQMLL